VVSDSSTAGQASDWIDAIAWDANGLVPAIAQDHRSGRILMVAWMNREALRLTVDHGQAHYWSRSRGKLWNKGETSGHVQQVLEVRLDCDRDAILLRVEQTGGIACHTGRESCFYQRLENGTWQAVDPILKAPEDIYRYAPTHD
jgi:phosphoribosyl-AMP cyclohydrolase